MPDDDAAPATFASLLHAERVKAGLSRRRFAAVTGLDFRYLRRLEAGERAHPSEDTLSRLADALNIHPAILRRAATTEPPQNQASEASPPASPTSADDPDNDRDAAATPSRPPRPD